MDPDQASEQSESSDEILFSQKEIPTVDGDPKARRTWIKSKKQQRYAIRYPRTRSQTVKDVMHLGDSPSEAYYNDKVEEALHLLRELPNLDDNTLQSIRKGDQDTSVKFLDSGETTEIEEVHQNSIIPQRFSRLKNKDKQSTQDQAKLYLWLW